MLALVASFGITALRHETAAPSPRSEAPAGSATAPELPQADWVVRSYPAGIKAKRNPGIMRRVRRATNGVAAALDELYSAAFLDPDGFGKATKAHLAPPAAKRFRNAGIAVAGAEDVQFKRRQTTIGVEGNHAKRAVARTDLVVVGRLDEGRFRVRHRATLWFDKSRGSWKVIGFRVAQGPRK